MSWLTTLSIFALSVASVVTSFHLSWVARRNRELERRVFDLEMGT